MKKILLTVIFFLLCLILFLIYNKFNLNNLNILYVGDDNIYYKFLNDNNYIINKYTFDNTTYKSLKSEILNNSYKIVKDKNIYLNQLISKADIIILSANNYKYGQKCKRNSKIIKEYNNIIFDEINELVLLIKKISHSKIYIIGNHCKSNVSNQDFSFADINYVSYDNANNIFNIIDKTAYNR